MPFTWRRVVKRGQHMADPRLKCHGCLRLSVLLNTPVGQGIWMTIRDMCNGLSRPEAIGLVVDSAIVYGGRYQKSLIADPRLFRFNLDVL